MASGTYYISTKNQYIDGYVAWSESNSNVGTNTSDVTMTVYLHRNNSWSGDPTHFTNKNLTRTFYINGTHSWTETTSLTIPNNGNYVQVATYTETGIAHNSDGTLSLSIGFEMSIAGGSPTGFMVSRQNSTATLDTIPRASRLNSVSINLNDNKITYNITRYSNSFSDNLTIYSGNQSFTLSSVSTSATETLNSSQLNVLYSIIGTGTSATVNGYLNTYNGSLHIGSSNTVAISISLPSYSLSWSQHICEDSVSAYNAYKSTVSDLIANLSKPTLTFAAASSTGSNYGRTIGYKINGTDSTSPKTITTYTGQPFTIVASDGRTSKDISWTADNAVIPYSLPTLQCTLVRTSPTSSTATATLKGTYYDGDGLTNLETLGLSFVYHESGGSDTTITSFTITSSTTNHIVSFTAVAQLTGLDYTKGIEFVASMTDLLGVAPSNINDTIPRGQPAWNAYYDNNGKSNFNVYGFYRRNEDCFFPIGYIYMSVDSTNPSTYFGGTWTQISDKFLLAAGSTYSAGGTGGAATVTLTENQIPSHRHSFSTTTDSGGTHSHTGNTLNIRTGTTATSKDAARQITADYDYYNVTITHDGGSHTHTLSGNTGYTGSTQSHDNMPPYLVVYMWKRTA